MIEKYRDFILAGAAVGLFLGLGFLFWFGLSDFFGGGEHMGEVLEEKPWRPMARVIFSIVMAVILIFFCGLTVKLATRDRG
jgi:uncharacterized membrane-anchored protein YitT (DUF2179 family)